VQKRAVDLPITRWPVTAETLVLPKSSPCGICDRRSDNGAGVLPSSSALACQYHSTMLCIFSNLQRH